MEIKERVKIRKNKCEVDKLGASCLVMDMTDDFPSHGDRTTEGGVAAELPSQMSDRALSDGPMAKGGMAAKLAAQMSDRSLSDGAMAEVGVAANFPAQMTNRSQTKRTMADRVLPSEMPNGADADGATAERSMAMR